MIPSPWAFALLALGVYRLVRLVGWDTSPPVVRARAWATGENPDSFATGIYRRPLVHDLIRCPFCLSMYVALAAWLAWWAVPTATLAVCAVLGLSGVVGLLAKNLDA